MQTTFGIPMTLRLRLLAPCPDPELPPFHPLPPFPSEDLPLHYSRRPWDSIHGRHSVFSLRFSKMLPL